MEIIKKNKDSDENFSMRNSNRYNTILKHRTVLSVTKHSSMPLKKRKAKRDEKAFV